YFSGAYVRVLIGLGTLLITEPLHIPIAVLVDEPRPLRGVVGHVIGDVVHRGLYAGLEVRRRDLVGADVVAEDAEDSEDGAGVVHRGLLLHPLQTLGPGVLDRVLTGHVADARELAVRGLVDRQGRRAHVHHRVRIGLA